jgi:ferredoxin-NADP reductase
MIVAAFAYVVLGGSGPAPIRSVALSLTFSALEPWDRVNVIYALREVLDEALREAGALHSREARLLDDERAKSKEQQP